MIYVTKYETFTPARSPITFSWTVASVIKIWASFLGSLTRSNVIMCLAESYHSHKLVTPFMENYGLTTSISALTLYNLIVAWRLFHFSPKFNWLVYTVRTATLSTGPLLEFFETYYYAKELLLFYYNLHPSHSANCYESLQKKYG